MPHYIDGFVLPVPKRNLAAYRRLAQKASKIWIEHGALDYRECVGEDLDVKFGLPFPRGIKIKPGETVVFACIVYKSRKDRDRVNAKVMAGPVPHGTVRPQEDAVRLPPHAVRRFQDPCGSLRVTERELTRETKETT